MSVVKRNARMPGQTFEAHGHPDRPARSGADVPPAFKPVALPALAAAVRSTRREPKRNSAADFSTLLRINAMFD